MGQLRKILMAHDLLAGGATALQSALTLAERSQATVKLVHVMDPTLFSRAVRLSQIHFPPLEELSRRAGQSWRK